MWKSKTFKTKEQLTNWLYKNQHNIQSEEIFVNNGYGILYRKLRIL